MEYRILGPLEVLDEGGVVRVGAGQQRALLGILLIHANQRLQVEQLAEELWGGATPESAVKTVQVLVSRLRKAAGPAVRIQTAGGGYRLVVEPDNLDAVRAETLVARGRSLLATQEPAAAATCFREALALWRGDSLEDFRYQPFAVAEAARLDELRRSATEDRIEADLALGRHREVAAELEALVAEHPLRERLWAQRMIALYRSGRQAEALTAYDGFRHALDEELGLVPGPELQRLQQAILRQDAELASPPPARMEVTSAFVGRTAEFSELSAALASARAGRGGLVLISGEAGIGKTRLADEFSRRADADGIRVAWGRSWEAGGAPAYWPWVQVLRAVLRVVPAARERLDAEHQLARILPELRGPEPDLPEPPLLDSEGARFRLFDATATFVREAAGTEPLVVVLDDVHAADVPSILLLEFLAVDLADSPVLLLAAFRESEQLVGLGRVAGRRISLRGLSGEEVTSFIARTSTLDANARVVKAIAAETEGNPLFVGELVRLLGASEPDEQEWHRAVLQGIRSVIARRLDGLAVDCVELLEQSAVLGREFSVAVLARMTGGAPDSLMDDLVEASRARILDQAPEVPSTLRFAHFLFRDALYERLAPSRRAERHRAAGAAIVEMHADDLDPYLAEVAHHFFLGAAGGSAEQAVRFGRLAAERALRVLAHEEAARLFEQTISVLDLSPPGDQALRCELLLALGDAQMRSGDMADAQTTFRRAAEIADRADLPEALARAAIGYGGPFMLDRRADDVTLVPLLEQALARLPSGRDRLRVRLLARLAGALRRDPSDRAGVLSAEAVELARRAGDGATLAYALDGSFAAMWRSPESVDRWLGVADEIVALSEAACDLEQTLAGRHHRIGALMHLGRVQEAEQELGRLASVAEALRQPAHLWFASTLAGLLTAFRGDLDSAETHIFEALTHVRETNAWDASSMHMIQLHGLRRQQGRLAEIDRELEPYLRRDRNRPLYGCMLIDLHFRLGRIDEAQALLSELGADGFRDLARDNEGIYGMALLSETCNGLEDVARADLLYELLLPYDGRNVTSYPEISAGAVARYLGLLAQTGGRFRDAERHFVDALAQNQQMGAAPWFAHTQRDYEAFKARVK